MPQLLTSVQNLDIRPATSATVTAYACTSNADIDSLDQPPAPSAPQPAANADIGSLD